MSWEQHFGQNTNVIAAYGGVQTLRANLNATQTRVYGLTDTLELGSLTLRAAYMYSQIKAVNGITAFGTLANAAAALPNGNGAAAAAQAQWIDHIYNPGHWGSLENYDVGAMYDHGSWLAMAEYSSHQSDHIFGRVTDGFVTVGYHYRQFTPYLGYSRVKTLQEHHGGPFDVAIARPVEKVEHQRHEGSSETGEHERVEKRHCRQTTCRLLRKRESASSKGRSVGKPCSSI